MFGEYQAVDATKLETASAEEKTTVATVQADAKKGALKTMALVPVGMLVCYLLLIFYFRSKGGYKAVVLDTPDNEFPTPGPTPA